jgi:competence protein ComEC
MEIENVRIIIKKRRKILFLLTIFIVIFIFSFLFMSINRNNYLEIVYLDIGQGDSILIKDPSGANLLVDTGSSAVASQKIQKELSFFNKSLDNIILTHPDSDHSGGLDAIVSSINTKNVAISSENNYSEILKEKDFLVSSVNTFNNILLSANIKLDIISPEPRMIGSGNGKSIVNTMLYGNFNFIFTGDADSETERKLVSQGYFDKNENKNIVNILKVGHHGSDTSSSEIFLKKIKPEYCIISVGRNNKYGHPVKNAMERLEKYCKNIYRTDKDGNVALETDGKNLKISTEK